MKIKRTCKQSLIVKDWQAKKRYPHFAARQYRYHTISIIDITLLMYSFETKKIHNIEEAKTSKSYNGGIRPMYFVEKMNKSYTMDDYLKCEWS